MQDQYQQTTETQNLQGITNPQNVRNNQTIQQGVLDTNQANISLYNVPSSKSITVPGVGQIAPITENSVVNQSAIPQNQNYNQIFLSSGVIIFIVLIFGSIYILDKIKNKEIEIL